MRKVVFLVFVLTSPLWLRGVISPTAQNQADEWLYIKVKSVKTEKHSKHVHVTVEAQVLKVFFSKDNKCKLNDIITIFYKVDNPELKNRPPKVIGGYVSPRILKKMKGRKESILTHF